MMPTLRDGTLVVVDGRAFARRPPRRGDLVAATPPILAGGVLVKRVVGLPHERVEIDGHAWQLGPEQYFLLGDRGEDSLDSRRFGPVSRQELLGHVRARLRPWSSLRHDLRSDLLPLLPAQHCHSPEA